MDAQVVNAFTRVFDALSARAWTRCPTCSASIFG